MREDVVLPQRSPGLIPHTSMEERLHCGGIQRSLGRNAISTAALLFLLLLTLLLPHGLVSVGLLGLTHVSNPLVLYL